MSRGLLFTRTVRHPCSFFDQVRFESLNFLDSQFNVPQGALLAHVCRKKVREMAVGSVDEKQAKWNKLIAGKAALVINVTVYNAKIVRIGPGDGVCHLQLDCNGSAVGCAVTVACVKDELAAKHRIKWTDPNFNYTLCRLQEGRTGTKIEDENELVDWGSSLMLIPSNAKQLIQLPLVLVDLPADSLEIDGEQRIPVNVKAFNSDSELFLELKLPKSCTALQLKQQLGGIGIDWAVGGSKVMSFGNKLIQNESIIPSSCEFPLKVIQLAP
jgi:hypothetical protein